MGLNSSYEMEFTRCWERIDQRVGKYFIFRKHLLDRVADIAARESIQKAEQWLGQFEIKYLRLNAGYCHVLSNDEELKAAADLMAKKSEAGVMGQLEQLKKAGLSGEQILKRCERIVIDICGGVGIDTPEADKGSGFDLKEYTAAKTARLFTAKWWRGKLRKLQARKLEIVSREFGLTNKSRGCYVSDASVYRRRQQVVRNRELLEKMEAENQHGQVYTLAELADKSVSNPVNKCSELMVRVRGFEEWARKDGGNWAPMFYTLTAPSRFHSHSRSGVEYQNWVEAGKPTPRDAMEWLTSVWVKCRAALDRRGIVFFGLRVAEPHHDGCPHFHILMWVPECKVKETTSILWGYAISEDKDLPPTEATLKRRFTPKRLTKYDLEPDTFKRKPVPAGAVFKRYSGRSAAGYVVKYITKNVHGAKLNGEEFEAGAVHTAYRVEAWASTWGFRQFQQLGGASVTVWREVRRLKEEQTDCAEIEEIRQAVDQSDWCSYTSLMGGAVLKRSLRPLRAFLVKKKNELDELVRNAYGEIMRKIGGIEAFGFLEYKTRLYDWVVRPVKRGVEGFGVGASPPCF